MKKLYIIWGCVFIIIAIISFNYKRESTNFYGIAETKEIVVNSENAVEIRKIHVVQGQVIRENDTLVELNRPELTMKITEITHQLNELKAQKLADASLSRSQIRQLQAQQAEKINQIKSQIKELEAQYELNRELTAKLKSIDKRDKVAEYEGANNPIKIKIASLKEELELASNPSQIKINRLQSELWSSGDPVKIHVERLEEELKLLLKGKNKLIICAQINGIIGSVNFKEGEMVSPFSPIITLHTKSPSFVKGYIHENVYSKVAIGQKVYINSLTDKNNKIIGDIVGVGSRIVEYPVRLRKRQDIQIWGRELLIKIPEDNEFLLGEKLLITSFKNTRLSIKKLLKRVFLGQKAYLAECEKKRVSYPF